MLDIKVVKAEALSMSPQKNRRAPSEVKRRKLRLAEANRPALNLCLRLTSALCATYLQQTEIPKPPLVPERGTQQEVPMDLSAWRDLTKGSLGAR